MPNTVQHWKTSSVEATLRDTRTVAIDTFEKIILLAFYCAFIEPVITAVYTRLDIAACLVLISESIVVILTLCRRPATKVSQRVSDWFLAFGATGLPMLVRPVEGPTYTWHTLAALLMLAGLAFQIFAKYTLGRRFGAVAANRGICDSGPYQIVRHPIYLGYMATHVGFLLVECSWWNLSVYTLFYAVLIPRILAEERLLTQDRAYAEYRQRVQYRLIPGVF